jgi:molybdopterin/thiamine biosynthesis adenylyltransferase
MGTPLIYNPKKETLSDFKNQHEVLGVIDQFEVLLEELFLIRNPRYKFNPNYQEDYEVFKKTYLNGEDINNVGVWFYFSWDKKLIHYLPEDEHQELRTARNKNIITKEEQDKFYHYHIAIAGMSVGSHSALTIAMMGGAKKMKIADPDEISGSNLNRLRYGYSYVGKNKAQAVAQSIYEMNPYAELEVYDQGVSLDTLGEFLKDADVFIEEMDNLELKIAGRLKAKEMGIPVLMATDNGDNVIVDVERYDLDKNLEIFNGAAGHLTLEEFRKIPPQEMPRLATKIAGPEFVVPRMQQSLLEVGKSLYSWPQLGDAATLSGVVLAYLIKRMSLGEKIKTGKFEFNMDAAFDPDYSSVQSEKNRKDQREEFFKIIGLE